MFEGFEFNITNENIIIFFLFKIVVLLLIFISLLLSNFVKIFIKEDTDLNNMPINNYLDNKKRNIKVCICTLGKRENRYIREFIDHYNKYGVDKIFLYDNNNIDEERFETLISDYIENNFVEIFNYRGKIAPQFKIYDECYKNNNKIYDWIIFYDIDEFIYLQNYSNIKDFLSKNIFNNCKSIYLNCIRHTDNDLLYYDNRTLVERFPDINWNSKMFTVKTILRGGLNGINFKTCHWLDRRIKGCNLDGKIILPSKKKQLDNDINSPSIRNYHIDHYCFKSTEEYINKLNKGDGVFGYNDKNRMHKINLYFNYNKVTIEKIIYIEKKCKLNLTKYRNILYSNN